MFDVFYFGKKPHIFSHEVQVQSVDEARQLSRTRFFWILNYLSDYNSFDFFWEPAPWESQYIHAWPSQWQKDGGTYLVPKYEHEGVRYQSTIIPRVIVENNWEISPNLDLKDFDYTWHPDPTEPPLNYQFGTQHQKTGGPRYVVKNATDTKYVQNISANVKNSYATKIWFIDHYDENIKKSIKTVSNNETEIEKTRYSSNYLDTLRRIAKRARGEHDFIWVCSSLCDYTNFDFSWHPEQWQSNMIHVFPSNEQKFGDTFFVPVNELLQQEDIELLEWHQINFITDISVPRWPMPSIKYSTDNLAESILKFNLINPLTQFYRLNKSDNPPTVSLWAEKTKTIVSLSDDASTAIIPRESKSYINDQVYDYPFIDKSFNHQEKSEEQDIIFISYDETNADANYKQLKDNFPRAARLHGIDGMVNAIKEAAKISKTPYYYVVFAKTLIYDGFNFDFVPDYMSVPCNYLFHGKNMSNDLEYGTLGVTMYNSKLIKEAKTWDIDFTTSFPVKVIPELSALGYFATDPYRAWRTAFRECTKLQSKCIRGQVDIETEYRLHIWTTFAKGNYSDWVLRGANDGVEYATIANNSYDHLRKINDWQWLRSYFDSKYSITESQI